MEPEVWIVLRNRGDTLEFCGIFSDEEKARQAATSRQHIIGPAVIDRVLPDAPVEWVGAYYPLAEGPAHV